jgi:hypothetical protein
MRTNLTQTSGKDGWREMGDAVEMADLAVRLSHQSTHHIVVETAILL